MKPTIYLGIGGTGIKTLAHVKYQFEKEYGVGNIPQEIAFVGMDADGGIDTSFCSDYINLLVSPNSIAQYYGVGSCEGEFRWMHEGNIVYIPGVLGISQSANAVRTNGRLLFDFHIRLFKNILSGIVHRVLYSSLQQEVDIYIVNSLVGGVGSGIFISAAVAIKEMFASNVNVYGFGVTHGVFEAMDPVGNRMPNVMYNCISSIIDLDYMFTATPEKPIYFEVGGVTIALTESVFDNFFIIDNKSDNNYEIRKIDELCEMLGLALYSFGLSGHFTHISHHLSFKMGLHDVKNKIGWVRGLGACEVVYKGKELAQIYAHKAATVLIHKMRQEDANIQDKVLSWIEEVGLREDDSAGIHQLIYSTCSQRAIDRLRLPDVNQENSDDANKQECQRYLTSLTQFPSDSYIATLLDGFKTKLDEKVLDLLKGNAAVGNALKFLELFKTYCERFRYEMDSEIVSLTMQKVELEDAFYEKAYNNYVAEKHGILTIRRAEKNQVLLEELVGYPALEILKLSYEIKRREVAYFIYNALISQTYYWCGKLEYLDHNLGLLYESLGTTLVRKQTGSRALVFEYDLSTNERQNMIVHDADVEVTSFIATLGEQSLLDVDYHTLTEKMLVYTENLPQAIAYKNRHIAQVINELSEDEYMEMKVWIERRIARWLRVDSRGEYVNFSQKSVEDAIIKNCLVSYLIESDEGSGISCRLENDRDFARNGLMKQFIPIYSENNKQRMIITSVDASVIPYCLAFIDPNTMMCYKQLIARCKTGQPVFNPHIDKGWFEKMIEENFQLKPETRDEFN